MNKQTQLPETTSHELIYQTSFGFKLKVLFLTLFCFLISFFLFFPIQKNLNKFITKSLSQNRKCPLRYQDLTTSFFFPALKMKKVKLPPQCFGKRSGQDLELDHVKVTLSLPTLFPPGLKTSVQVKKGRSIINAYPRLSFGETVVRLTKSSITGDLLSTLIGLPNLLKGSVETEGLFTIRDNSVEKGDFKITSNDLMVPAQNISGFDLIAMDMKKLLIAGSLVKNKLNLKALKIGVYNSPLEAEFKGKIGLVPGLMNRSSLDLKGKVRFDITLKQSLPILDLFLTGKKQVKSFYPMSLSGTFAAPKPNFLK